MVLTEPHRPPAEAAAVLEALAYVLRAAPGEQNDAEIHASYLLELAAEVTARLRPGQSSQRSSTGDPVADWKAVLSRLLPASAQHD
jgi:hypothetical protein